MKESSQTPEFAALASLSDFKAETTGFERMRKDLTPSPN